MKTAWDYNRGKHFSGRRPALLVLNSFLEFIVAICEVIHIFCDGIYECLKILGVLARD
jgi:hypothetical protein